MPGADNSRIPPLPGQNFDVMSLTDQDEIILQAVLQKDDVEMRILETRISELRKEIQDIRSASALVGGDDQSSICARCKFKFPAFSLPWADRGRRCNACKFKVCSRCCFTQSNGWLLCILCLKCRQEKLLTGEWMSTGQRDHLHGSQLLKALLRDRRRVPRSAYEETKIPTNYTQRPAKIQDGDSESRTSKNSQSSLEAADLRQQEKLASAKKAIDTKEEEHVLDDGKRGLSVQHHRDSYFRALESADITVRHPKGNKHINKHHWWQKVSRPVHARDEVAPLAQSSDLESETSSLSSFSLDSQHASRGTNNDSSCEDRESLTRKRFRQGSTVSELAKRTVDLPAALPSRFRFRRTSSVSDNDVQERRLINDHSKQQMAVSDERINASKIQVQPLWNETKTNTSQPSKHQRLLPNIDGTLKNSSIQASKNMHPAPITGTSIQHVSHDDKNSRKKPPTSGNFEEVYNSSVNRLVTFMTGGNTPAQTESRDNSNPSQIKKEEQQSSDTEPIKETDSGITSGQTTRTNTPEQRLQPQKSLSDQSSVPTINVTNIGGENYREENDDLDELFYNHQPNHLLGSRSSLADSRESIYSVYSDAGEVNYGRFPVTGEIMFNITYDSKSTTLKIHVKQCRDLAAVDNKHNRSDPYVKTYLLPDKTRASKRKTRIKKHTLNPVFDEILQYKIRSDELASRSLWLTVWHNDRLGRNDFLGEVTIPLDYYPFDNSKPMWYPLQERIVTQEPVMYYKGDLFISLKYVPADMVEVAAPKKVKSNSFRKKGKHKERETANSNLGEIQVLVREAQNLTAMRDVGGSDPFCKGYLLPHGSHSTKQKTPVIRKTVNPQWQHILVFEGVDQSQLHEHGLELTVWDHDKLSSNDFLGGVRLNLGQGTHLGKYAEWMDAKGEEIEVWQSMMEHPNEWIDAMLPLRASMGKDNTKKQ